MTTATVSPMSGGTERYLVIGGAGFLGSYIAQALVDRGEKYVAVYDLNKPGKSDIISGVQYFCGDILNEQQLLACLRSVSAFLVHFTCSDDSPDLCHCCVSYGLSSTRLAGVCLLPN